MAKVILYQAETLRQILLKENHEILACDQRDDADLVISEEIFLPEMATSAPVLVIISRENLGEEIRLLEAGATSVLSRPFDPAVLLARVRALSRGGSGEKNEIYTFANLRVDASRFSVTSSGRELRLTAGQFKVLLLLIKRPGEVLSRAEVIGEISPGLPENSRSVDTLISSLRSELRDAGTIIESIRGVGYSLRSGTSLRKT